MGGGEQRQEAQRQYFESELNESKCKGKCCPGAVREMGESQAKEETVESTL